MKLKKVDILLAESRPLEKVTRLAPRYSAVVCPFCGRENLVFDRNFANGCRCKNPDCRAMLRKNLGEAVRDMVPAKGGAN